MEFNEKLQQLRKQKGLTQEELAQALYVSRTAISKWESGKGYPNLESLKAIAVYFDVTVDALLSPDQRLTIYPFIKNPVTKQEFLSLLRERLTGLPMKDVEACICLYGDRIDDCMEDGLTEAAAVATVGTLEEIAERVWSEISPVTMAKTDIKRKRRLHTWEIVWLVAGSPVWLSLLFAATALIFSLYVLLWAVVVSFWSVFVALIAACIGLLAGGIGIAVGGHVLSGLALVAVALMCAGLAVFAFFGSRVTTKGAVWLGKTLCLQLKRCCAGKGDAQ